MPERPTLRLAAEAGGRAAGHEEAAHSVAALLELSRRAADEVVVRWLRSPSNPRLRRPVRLAEATFGSGHYLFRQIFGVLPARPVGRDGWEPVPFRDAVEAELRPVLAVRAGPPAMLAGDGVALPMPRPGFASAAPPDAVRAAWSALRGSDLVDLVALDWAMRARPRTLTGAARALGVQDPTEFDEGPVVVCRTVADWVGTLFTARGVLPLGSQQDQADFLRGFSGGLVCQSPKHRRQLEELLAVPAPTIPPIVVASPSRVGDQLLPNGVAVRRRLGAEQLAGTLT